jgi:hypothetical protein
VPEGKTSLGRPRNIQKVNNVSWANTIWICRLTQLAMKWDHKQALGIKLTVSQNSSELLHQMRNYQLVKVVSQCLFFQPQFYRCFNIIISCSLPSPASTTVWERI